MREVVENLVRELPAPDTGTAFARVRPVTRLNYEIWDVPVESAAGKVTRGAQRQKIFTSLGGSIAEQLHFYVSEVCVQSH